MRFLPAIRRWIRPRAIMIPRYAVPESRAAQHILGATRGQARFPIRNVAYRRSRLSLTVHEQDLRPHSATPKPESRMNFAPRLRRWNGIRPALIAIASIPCARPLVIAPARFMRNAGPDQNRGTQLSQMERTSGQPPSCHARLAGTLRDGSSKLLSRRITPRDPPLALRFGKSQRRPLSATVPRGRHPLAPDRPERGRRPAPDCEQGSSVVVVSRQGQSTDRRGLRPLDAQPPRMHRLLSFPACRPGLPPVRLAAASPAGATRRKPPPRRRPRPRPPLWRASPQPEA